MPADGACIRWLIGIWSGPQDDNKLIWMRVVVCGFEGKRETGRDKDPFGICIEVGFRFTL